jgi:hypothetical protein
MTGEQQRDERQIRMPRVDQLTGAGRVDLRVAWIWLVKHL